MRYHFFVSIVFAIILVSSGFAQQNAEQLYQSGIYKEEVEGNLESAIAIYKEIVEKFPDSRSIAAKAILHIGLCYEKLGLKEAQTAFQSVIDNYPEQTEVVKVAKEKLSLLLRARSVVEKGDKELKIRQAWAPALGSAMGAPSPDGRYLSYVNWDTIEIAVHDLKTGKDRDLTDLTNEGTWKPPMQFPDASIWSPDSKQIAYFWIMGERPNRTAELRIVGLDGSKPRILCTGKEGYTPWPSAWSRDGKYILALLIGVPYKAQPQSYEDHIVLVSVADGSVRVLRSLGKRITHYMSLSPDGRYIVYDLQQKEGSKKRDIFLLSTDGNHEMPLVEHPADDFAPFWAPDGKRIVFFSDRTGTNGLWVLHVVAGMPQEEPQLLKDNLEEAIGPMGITVDGSLYYSIQTMAFDVYTASLDFKSGKVLTPPKKLSLRHEGTNWKPFWSPGGKFLAYESQRKYRAVSAMENITFVIHNIKTGEEQDLTPKLYYAIPHGWSYPRWSPDGRSILVHARTEKRHEGFFLVDIQTGKATPIISKEKETKEHIGCFPDLSPDGKKIFYLSNDQKSIVVRDLGTGKEKKLYRGTYEIRWMVLSPDGRQLAFRFWFDSPNKLWVIPSTGGEPRELFRLPKDDKIDGPCWTPDGRHVVFESLNKKELWRIPAKGGKPQKIEFSMDNMHRLNIHPDGRRIAFTQQTGHGREVWAMENFLPKLKDKK